VNDTCEDLLRLAEQYVTARESTPPDEFWDGFRRTCDQNGVTGRAERNVLLILIEGLRTALANDITVAFAGRQ